MRLKIFQKGVSGALDRMDCFMDAFNANEPDGRWVLVDPRSLEPLESNPASTSHPGVSHLETATSHSDPIVESTSCAVGKRNGIPMHMQDPEREGLTETEKRKISKAIFSRKYRQNKNLTLEALKNENNILKKGITENENEIKLLMMSIRYKSDLIKELQMKGSATNEFNFPNP